MDRLGGQVSPDRPAYQGGSSMNGSHRSSHPLPLDANKEPEPVSRSVDNGNMMAVDEVSAIAPLNNPVLYAIARGVYADNCNLFSTRALARNSTPCL